MPDSKSIKIYYFLPSISWAIIILILCGFPGEILPELTFWEWLQPDKLAHIFLFGIQCFLLMKSFRHMDPSTSIYKYAGTVALAMTISYGILVEVLQTYVFIQRNGDVRDALANAIGALTGAWLFNRIAKKKSHLSGKTKLN